MLINFEEGTKVAYVPNHANGDFSHKDVEFGIVSSVNKIFVFVKFDKQVRQLGLEDTTAQACNPKNLVLMSKQHV